MAIRMMGCQTQTKGKRCAPFSQEMTGSQASFGVPKGEMWKVTNAL